MSKLTAGIYHSVRSLVVSHSIGHDSLCTYFSVVLYMFRNANHIVLLYQWVGFTLLLDSRESNVGNSVFLPSIQE